MKREGYYLYVLFLILIFSSCERVFQYSVLEVRPQTSDLNNKAINQIKELVPRDSFTFLVISDTQVSYDELESFVKYANRITEDSIAFVLHGGDFTDYGANFEFDFYYDQIRKLRLPIIGVIGNHDMLGNGREIYRRYFGVENFSFEYGNTAFVAYNSNSREVAFDGSLPDLDWLEKEIKKYQHLDNIIYLSHIAPDVEDFDQSKSAQLVGLLADSGNSLLSIHGHTHSYKYGEPYADGVKYLVAPTLGKRSFVKVDVHGKEVRVEEVFY